MPTEPPIPTPELVTPSPSPVPTANPTGEPTPTAMAAAVEAATPTTAPTLVPTATSTPVPTPTMAPVPTLTPTPVATPGPSYSRLEVLPDPFAIHEMTAVCDPITGDIGELLSLTLNLHGQAPGRSWGSSSFYHVELSTLPTPTPTPASIPTPTPAPSTDESGGFQGTFTVRGINTLPGLYWSFPGDPIRGWVGSGDVTIPLALDPEETDWRFSDWRIAWQLCGEDELFFWGSSRETSFPKSLRDGDLSLELTVKAIGNWALWVLVPEGSR